MGSSASRCESKQVACLDERKSAGSRTERDAEMSRALDASLLSPLLRIVCDYDRRPGTETPLPKASFAHDVRTDDLALWFGLV